MERYWCLRWLEQEDARQVEAVVLKDEVLRLVDIPLVIRLPGMPQAARGAQVRLDILHWDELDLSVEVRWLEMLTTAPQEALGEAEEEEETGAQEVSADSESADMSGEAGQAGAIEAGDTSGADEPAVSDIDAESVTK